MATPTQVTRKALRDMTRNGAVEVTETEKPARAPRRKRQRVLDEWQMTETEQATAKVFMRVARANGWQADTIKFPCEHRPAAYWYGKPYNAVVIWRGREQRMWCMCEIVAMSEAEMARVIEDLTREE